MSHHRVFSNKLNKDDISVYTKVYVEKKTFEDLTLQKEL